MPLCEVCSASTVGPRATNEYMSGMTVGGPLTTWAAPTGVGRAGAATRPSLVLVDKKAFKNERSLQTTRFINGDAELPDDWRRQDEYSCLRRGHANLRSIHPPPLLEETMCTSTVISILDCSSLRPFTFFRSSSRPFRTFRHYVACVHDISGSRFFSPIAISHFLQHIKASRGTVV